MEKELKLGLVGLGRLGKSYGENITFKVPNAKVAAACSIVDAELDWARETLGVKALYSDYNKMIAEEKLDGVVIVSSTTEHAWQIIAGLEAGLHVYCEKPIALGLEQCQEVEKAEGLHPNQIFMLGFVRRFDPSYAYAKKRIDEGAIGKPFLVRSQTADMDKWAKFGLEFTEKSGGIFLDFNVHDIDLARWFLGSEIKTVWSMNCPPVILSAVCNTSVDQAADFSPPPLTQ